MIFSLKKFYNRVRRQDEKPYWCDETQAGFGFNNFEAIKKICEEAGF